MFMPVLKKNEGYQLMHNLLLGEVKELEKATMQYLVSGHPKDRGDMTGEVLDVVQVCIGILDKLEREGADIELATMEHLRKLSNRQIWTIDKMIKIEVL